MPKFFNFLTRKIEQFKPTDKVVGLYTCGPTVYDYVHIGNWRTFVFEDILKRALLFNDIKVKHVMNLTDVDDKIIKKASDQGISIKELTDKFAKAFFDDLSKLNIISADVYPKATDQKYMDKMIELIQKLLEKGVAYKGDDGIYFSVEKFPDYGKLSGLEKQQLKKGARVNDDEYDKENWSDFALWKYPSTRFARSGQAPEPSWDAPFGEGRPGWHVECSAMSIAHLGESFDIHTGGVDLLFPHHENEIAQSEAATGKKFVKIWMEGEHLLADGEKMAKRLGNVYTLADIVKRDFDPLALRYLFLTAHYRSKLNFTWKSLEAAQNAFNNLIGEIESWEEPKIGCSEFEANFKEAVNNDLDMPKALSTIWEMIKSNYPTSAKHQSILKMDEVLGLGLAGVEKARLPKGAKELIKKREELRKIGEFEKSDKLREKLQEMGVEVEDTPEGSKWKIKSTNNHD